MQGFHEEMGPLAVYGYLNVDSRGACDSKEHSSML